MCVSRIKMGELSLPFWMSMIMEFDELGTVRHVSLVEFIL